MRNINDVDNCTPAGGPTPRYKPEYEEFRYFASLMRQLQIQGNSFEVAFKDRPLPSEQLSEPSVAIERLSGKQLIMAAEGGYEFRLGPDGESATLWTQESEEQIQILRFSEDVRTGHEVLEICRILELDPTEDSYEILTDVEGQLGRANSRRTGIPSQMDRTELIMSTRSPKEAMYFLSQVVEVPESHIKDGQVQVTLDHNRFAFDWKDVMGDLFPGPLFPIVPAQCGGPGKIPRVLVLYR